MKIVDASKLVYRIQTEPANASVNPVDCERRTATERVISEGPEHKRLVPWEVKDEAFKLMEAAAELVQQKKYDEAGQKYRAAIEADPEAADLYFFYGNTLIAGANDAEAALKQYKKGIALDPTLPSGHLYASIADTRLGRIPDAREEIVKALATYPRYGALWKLIAKPENWKVKPIVRHKFEPPSGLIGKSDNGEIEIYTGKDSSWAGYAVCKGVWANEAQFSKEHKADGWSLEEERACVLTQMWTDYARTEAALAEAQKKNGVVQPDVKREDVIAALEPLDRHLWDVNQAKLLDGYIYFEIIGQHCPLAMSTLSDEAAKGVEDYIRKYVIVTAE